jgi:hypothetical protein
MKHEAWLPYQGSSALILAAILLAVTGVLAWLGTRLRGRIGAERPGKLVTAAIVIVFLLSGFSFLKAVAAYLLELKNQLAPLLPSATGHARFPRNPITPITLICGLASFVGIILLTRKHGAWKALVSAVVGSIAAPFIFELPFDLIVMTRTHPPNPASVYTPLFFLPLFALAVSSFAMLSFSSAMKLSKQALFCLAAMFFVFAIWALLGFGYPSTPILIALNGISKVLAFAASVALFLPLRPEE